ncbi:MAG TPA: TonB-dependent receptor plug domain-containing protein, partial [Nitrosopumilaceae archaeon]|nr:TonB-dependent receptor plug domain-containing protein [Nitrosopumilaceae archaeon]
MRITTLLIFVISLHLSAKTTAQKITLVSNNISIEQFFNQLEKQTGYSFLLENGVVSKDEKITINVKDATLETVLDQILVPINLSYKIENKTVYIIKATKPAALADVILPPIDIHGHVTDSLGNPLAGASVTVKGSKRGTTTDAKGDFVLHGVNESASIIISFTGYDSKTIKLNGSNSFSISLAHSNSQLDQIQIIAYGTTTQRFATGDVSTVNSKTIEEQPVVNALGTMEGRVPGLYIIQNSGVPGGSFQVQIRGQNSIANGNSPLYVIDGIQYSPITSNNGVDYNASPANPVTNNADYLNPLNFLNSLDIESISVLKDADATAIYGSRGANGVILITTKKGKAGTTKAEINLYTGTERVGHFMKLLNTQQYVAMREEALSNDGLTPNLQNAPDLLSYDTTKYTDWQKTLIGGVAHI